MQNFILVSDCCKPQLTAGLVDLGSVPVFISTEGFEMSYMSLLFK